MSVQFGAYIQPFNQYFLFKNDHQWRVFTADDIPVLHVSSHAKTTTASFQTVRQYWRIGLYDTITCCFQIALHTLILRIANTHTVIINDILSLDRGTDTTLGTNIVETSFLEGFSNFAVQINLFQLLTTLSSEIKSRRPSHVLILEKYLSKSRYCCEYYVWLQLDCFLGGMSSFYGTDIY